MCFAGKGFYSLPQPSFEAFANSKLTDDVKMWNAITAFVSNVGLQRLLQYQENINLPRLNVSSEGEPRWMFVYFCCGGTRVVYIMWWVKKKSGGICFVCRLQNAARKFAPTFRPTIGLKDQGDSIFEEVVASMQILSLGFISMAKISRDWQVWMWESIVERNSVRK